MKADVALRVELLGTLPSLSVRVEVDRPAYVYVLQLAGMAYGILHPEEGAEGRVLPGEPVLLPARGGAFALDPSAEHLCVVAAERPIEGEDWSFCFPPRGDEDRPPPEPIKKGNSGRPAVHRVPLKAP